MATLQEQLKEIEKEEQDHRLSNPRIGKLENVLRNTEGSGCFLSFIFICLVLYLVFGVIFRKVVLGGWFIFVFYSSLILISFLSEWIEALIVRLAHGFYNITKEELAQENSFRAELAKKKNQIRFEIKKEEDGIRRGKEQAFIIRLNEFLNKLENGKISKEEALIVKKELEKVNIELWTLGYQIYTKLYYNNRFKKIEDILSNTISPQSYPLHPSSNKNIFNSPSSLNKPNVSPKQTTESISKATHFSSHNEPSRTNQKPEKIEEELSTKIEIPSSNNDNLDEQKSIAELFENIQPKSNLLKDKFENPATKIDYLKLQERRQTIGLLGELFALEWEKNRLDKGLKKFAGNVSHVSQNNDSVGYDILSFCEDGSPKYIEVKTTTDNYNSSFYLTETEIMAMKKLDNYFIYRIYNFNVETKRGTIFIIDCNVDINKYYKVEAVSYRVSPK